MSIDIPKVDAPPPRRVRVAGTLDMIWASRRTFLLRLDDGRPVRGRLLQGDAAELAPYLGRRILVHGSAVFRAEGRLLRLDADEFRPATDADRLFAAMPKPLTQDCHRPAIPERDDMAQRLQAIMGRWPGEELAAEVRAALEGPC